jgi:HlyD family secretion protein
LRPGGYAEAVIDAGQRQALTVAQSAVQYDGDGASLLLLGADNRVRKARVKTGALLDDTVEIVSGAQVGDRVVLSGGALLLPGDRVSPTPALALNDKAAR